MQNLRPLALLLATTLMARAAVLPPAQDTFSASGKLAAAAGKATTLSVSAKNKAYILFDLETLPAGLQSTDIVSARLRVYFPTVTKAGDLEVHAVAPTGPLWTETTAAAVEPAAGPLLQTLPAAGVIAKKFAEVDVTAIVQDWIAGTSENFGFVLTTAGLTKVTLGAKEGSGTGYPCELDLEIADVPPAGTVGSDQLAANLTFGGTTVFTGGISLPPTSGASEGAILQSAIPIFHTFGTENIFLGSGTGNFSLTGRDNTALGFQSLTSVTTSGYNVALGGYTLAATTTGSANVATGYQALEKNITGSYNTAVGLAALHQNISGYSNTAIGSESLIINTSGVGNTGVGDGALGVNQTGNRNIALGASAGRSLTGSSNIAIGNIGVAGESGVIRIGTTGTHTDTYLTGNIHGLTLPATSSLSDGTIAQDGSTLLHTAGSQNIFLGKGSGNLGTNGNNNVGLGPNTLGALTSGAGNTASGSFALNSITTAEDNTASGQNALRQLTSGNGNIAIGGSAGQNLTTGSKNIDIGSPGLAADSGIIRIGTNQTKTFIAGIVGVTTGSPNAYGVVIDANGQLGITSSSRRYKEDIADMGDASARLESLHPVTFRYKKAFDNGEKPTQFGLIAEEVADSFPELVLRNAEGQPESVKYQDLTPLLLNEFLKERRRSRDAETALHEENDSLKKENEALLKRLERIEERLGKP